MLLALSMEEGATGPGRQTVSRSWKKQGSGFFPTAYTRTQVCWPILDSDHQTVVLSYYTCGDLSANRKLIQQWSISSFHSSPLWDLYLLPLVLLLGVFLRPALLEPVPLVTGLKVIETLGEWCCFSCLIIKSSVSPMCDYLRYRLEGYSV